MVVLNESFFVKLFDLLKEYGINEDKYSECRFKEGDLVLGRDSEDGVWHLSAFKTYDPGCDYPYKCKDTMYKHVIQYHGNEYLLGTTNSEDGEI